MPSDGFQAAAERLHRSHPSVFAAVTAVVDPHRLTWVEHSELDRRTHRSEFRIAPDHYADRLRCSGAIDLVVMDHIVNADWRNDWLHDPCDLEFLSRIERETGIRSLCSTIETEAATSTRARGGMSPTTADEDPVRHLDRHARPPQRCR